MSIRQLNSEEYLDFYLVRKFLFRKYLRKCIKETYEVIPVKKYLYTKIYQHVLRTNIKIFIIKVYTRKNVSSLNNLSVSLSYKNSIKYGLFRLRELCKREKFKKNKENKVTSLTAKINNNQLILSSGSISSQFSKFKFNIFSENMLKRKYFKKLKSYYIDVKKVLPKVKQTFWIYLKLSLIRFFKKAYFIKTEKFHRSFNIKKALYKLRIYSKKQTKSVELERKIRMLSYKNRFKGFFYIVKNSIQDKYKGKERDYKHYMTVFYTLFKRSITKQIKEKQELKLKNYLLLKKLGQLKLKSSIKFILDKKSKQNEYKAKFTKFEDHIERFNARKAIKAIISYSKNIEVTNNYKLKQFRERISINVKLLLYESYLSAISLRLRIKSKQIYYNKLQIRRKLMKIRRYTITSLKKKENLALATSFYSDRLFKRVLICFYEYASLSIKWKESDIKAILFWRNNWFKKIFNCWNVFSQRFKKEKAEVENLIRQRNNVLAEYAMKHLLSKARVEINTKEEVLRKVYIKRSEGGITIALKWFKILKQRVLMKKIKSNSTNTLNRFSLMPNTTQFDPIMLQGKSLVRPDKVFSYSSLNEGIENNPENMIVIKKAVNVNTQTASAKRVPKVQHANSKKTNSLENNLNNQSVVSNVSLKDQVPNKSKKTFEDVEDIDQKKLIKDQKVVRNIKDISHSPIQKPKFELDNTLLEEKKKSEQIERIDNNFNLSAFQNTHKYFSSINHFQRGHDPQVQAHTQSIVPKPDKLESLEKDLSHLLSLKKIPRAAPKKKI